MAPSQAELESIVAELTTNAYECFANDISTMFDTEITAQQMDYGEGTVADLKDKYKKLAAVSSVKSEGVLNGEFHFVFDKEGLFTMAGTFVMQPEKVIAQNCKTGTEQEAKEIGDAIGEVGNLQVGSWDKLFREEMEGHGHFVQSGTFVGNPWSSPEKSIRLTKDEPLILIQYQFCIDPHEPFQTTVVYPKSLFEGGGPVAKPEPEAEAEAQEPAEQPPAEENAEPAPEQPAGETETQPEPAQQPANPANDAQVEQQIASQPAPAPQPVAAPDPGAVSQAIQYMNLSGQLPSMLSDNTNSILAGVNARQIMRTSVGWADPEDTVEQLVAKMQQFDTGYLMVGKEEKLEGIVSKSDVRGAMSPYLQSMFIKWRGPMDVATLQIKAKWVMSRPVRTVTPDASIAYIMRAMIQHGGRCVPVVENTGKVLGMITVFDIFRVLLNGTGKNTSGNTGQSPPLA